MDVLNDFPIRKTNKQKSAFREAVRSYVTSMGYPFAQEQCSFGGRNLVIGDPNTAKYLITAHYDTPASIGIPNVLTPCNPVTFLVYQVLVVSLFLAVSFGVAYLAYILANDPSVAFVVWYIVYFGMLGLMMFGPANRHNANDNTSGVLTVLETAAAMPRELRGKVCFVLFDLEEAGLIGSSAYRKAHKDATEKQIVLNLDCVGNGDHFLMIPVKNAKKDADLLNRLMGVCETVDGKDMTVRAKGFTAGSSDHKNFPYGVGIMAFHKAKNVGLYCDRIHTWRDTVLQTENITILRDKLIDFISSDAVK